MSIIGIEWRVAAVAIFALSILAITSNLAWFGLILGLYFLWRAYPFIASSTTRGISVAVILGLFIFDPPGALPYNQHLALTEILGAFFYESLKNHTPLPIPFSAVEIFSYSLAVFHLQRIWQVSSKNLKMSLVVAAFLVPATCVIAVLYGFLKGQNLGLAFTQVRPIPLLGAWTIIGTSLVQHGLDIDKLFRYFFMILFLKSLYAVSIFYLVYGGYIEGREYLIDHIFSFLSGSVLTYVFWQLISPVTSLRAKMHWFFPMLIILWAFHLNDRRVALLGLVFSIGFLVFSLRLVPLRRIWRGLGVMLLMAATTYAIVKADTMIETNGILDGRTGVMTVMSYRQLEDSNLLYSVMGNALTGLGFGTRFPIYLPMPDISFVYDLFDAIPHNTLLYLWTFAGPLGIGSLISLISISLSVGLRAWRVTMKPTLKIHLFVLMSLLIQWFCYVVFDLGLMNIQALALAGFAIGSILTIFHQVFETEEKNL